MRHSDLQINHLEDACVPYPTEGVPFHLRSVGWNCFVLERVRDKNVQKESVFSVSYWMHPPSSKHLKFFQLTLFYIAKSALARLSWEETRLTLWTGGGGKKYLSALAMKNTLVRRRHTTEPAPLFRIAETKTFINFYRPLLCSKPAPLP